jgi:hypothetical protein
MKQLVERFRVEVSELRRQVELMEAGTLLVWSVKDGVKHDYTADSIERNKASIAEIEACINRAVSLTE